MKNKNYSLLFIFITIFIDITGLGIIIPIIPSLISELIDGSISEAAMYSGWLMFSYATLQFLFAPILSYNKPRCNVNRFLEKLGRKLAFIKVNIYDKATKTKISSGTHTKYFVS